MNDWQKLAAIMKTIAAEPDVYGKDTVELAITPTITEMVKNDYFAVAAKSGENEVSLIEKNGNKYVLIFPDEETAKKIGAEPMNCPVRELFVIAGGTEGISGLQLVYDVNEENKSFEAAEIPRSWLLNASVVGAAVLSGEHDKELKRAAKGK